MSGTGQMGKSPIPKFTAALCIGVSGFVAYLLFGPVLEETYFRLDATGPREGDLLISQTPTDLSSVHFNWTLLVALVCAAVLSVGFVLAGIREIMSGSMDVEVQE
jgi:hypothetical protein